MNTITRELNEMWAVESPGRTCWSAPTEAGGWRRAALCALLIVGCSDSGPTRAPTFQVRSGWIVPERIVLIVVDTLRRDALYDSPLRTPHIGGLAARGQVFLNAYGSFHQTTMSMGAMFTGRTPSLESGTANRPLKLTPRTWCGMARFGGGTGQGCIPESLPGLAERLRAAGYETIGVASNSLVFDPFGIGRGFDDWTEVGEPGLHVGASRAASKRVRRSRRSDTVNQAALAALRRRHSERFFLYIHYMDVHDYNLRSPHGYGEAVEQVDGAVGELVAGLQALRLMPGTAIILTSDHGERLTERHLVEGTARHRGNPAFEETISIPLIVAPPLVDDPTPIIRTQDVFDLVLQMAGQEVERERDLASDELFLTEHRYQTYRKGRFKSFLSRQSDRLLLVDLESDAGELHDVSDAYPDVVREHRRRIAELAEKLAAPDARPGVLQKSDMDRLRALGYVE